MKDLRKSVADAIGQAQCKLVDGVVYTLKDNKRKTISTFDIQANDRTFSEFHQSLVGIEGDVYGVIRFENGDTYHYNPSTNGKWILV